MATFTDLTVSTLGEGYALQASSEMLPPGQSSEFDVTAPPASKLEIATDVPGSFVAGTPFDLVVDAENNLGSIDPLYNGAVTLTLVGGSSAATLDGTLQVDATAGVAKFSDLTLDLAGRGYTIKISSGALTGTATGDITVTPAAADQLLIHTLPSSTATAGQPFATQPVVFILDQFGNLETADNSTSITASLATGNGPLSGTTAVSVSGGVATFTDLSDDYPGVISLSFAGAGLAVSPSNDIFISPPVPTISGESVVMTPKLNKKGKPTGKTEFAGFEIDYSIPMDPSTAGDSAYYQVFATSTKRVKKKTEQVLKPVNVAAKYQQANQKNSVILTIKSVALFATGGQIRITSTPSDGVTSEDGVALSPIYTVLTISPTAKTIRLG